MFWNTRANYTRTSYPGLSCSSPLQFFSFAQTWLRGRKSEPSSLEMKQTETGTQAHLRLTGPTACPPLGQPAPAPPAASPRTEAGEAHGGRQLRVGCPQHLCICNERGEETTGVNGVRGWAGPASAPATPSLTALGRRLHATPAPDPQQRRQEAAGRGEPSFLPTEGGRRRQGVGISAHGRATYNVSARVVQMLLERCQAWCPDKLFPVKPLSGTDHPLRGCAFSWCPTWISLGRASFC